MDTDSVRYRRAKADDYTGVMAIGQGILGGYDYLPAMFMRYITDPNVLLCVAELAGEIVAFGGVCLVDGGNVVQCIAARVKVGHRKSGLLTGIRQYLAAELKPEVRFFVGAVESWDVYRAQSKKGLDVWMTLTQNLVRFRLSDHAVLNAARRSGRSDHIVSEVSTKDAFIQLMEYDDNKWRLFPSRRVILKHHSYKLMRSNFETIWDYACKCIVTKPAAAKDPNYCLSLSLAKSYPVPKTMVYYSIDYYGREVNDLIDHVEKHMGSARQLIGQGKFTMCLQMPSSLGTDEVKQGLVNRHSAVDFVDVHPVAYQAQSPLSSQL